MPIEFELLHKASRSGSKGMLRHYAISSWKSVYFLTHCHFAEVIKMYDWFERRSSYILVMERPQPVIDLFDYLNQYGPMPLPSAKKIFRQVGVLHTVNKLDNIVNLEVKLLLATWTLFIKLAKYIGVQHSCLSR